MSDTEQNLVHALSHLILTGSERELLLFFLVHLLENLSFRDGNLPRITEAKSITEIQTQVLKISIFSERLEWCFICVGKFLKKSYNFFLNCANSQCATSLQTVTEEKSPCLPAFFPPSF